MSAQIEDPFDGIVPCLVHSSEMDEDCEHCESEFDAKNEIAASYAAQAQDLAKALAQHGVSVPDIAIMSTRLELLIEALLRDRNRIHFEVECGRRVVEMFEANLKNAKRQTLATVGKKQDLIVPNRAFGRG